MARTRGARDGNVSEERAISESEGSEAVPAAPGSAHPLWMGFATGLLLGTGVGLVVALPGAWRASSAGASFVAGWLVLWGAAALLMGPLAGALRLLRPEPRGLVVLALGVGLASGPWMVFAQLLKRATHHRPLGAVTFAVLGTAILIGALLISARVFAMAQGSGRGRRFGRMLAIVLAVIAGLFVLRVVGGVLLAGGLRSGLLDGALAALGVIGAAVAPLPTGAAGRVRLAGPASWLLVIGGALVALHLADGLPAILNSAAPVLYSVLALIGH